MTKSRGFSFYMFVITILFFYIPLLVLMVYSFNGGKNVWEGFSIKWYEELFFYQQELWRTLINSIFIAIVSATLATTIGTLGAIGLHWYNFRAKTYLQVVTYLPLIIPEIIIGVSLLMFFATFKFTLGITTVFLAHTTFSIPFVLFIVLSRLQEFDYSIIEAAYDLGAKEMDVLLKVIVPITMPGIISGFLMALTLSIDDFVITFFVSGNGFKTLPIHIYTIIKSGVAPVVNALSVILVFATIGLSAISKNFNKYMFS